MRDVDCRRTPSLIVSREQWDRFLSVGEVPRWLVRLLVGSFVQTRRYHLQHLSHEKTRHGILHWQSKPQISRTPFVVTASTARNGRTSMQTMTVSGLDGHTYHCGSGQRGNIPDTRMTFGNTALPSRTMQPSRSKQQVRCHSLSCHSFCFFCGKVEHEGEGDRCNADGLGSDSSQF